MAAEANDQIRPRWICERMRAPSPDMHMPCSRKTLVTILSADAQTLGPRLPRTPCPAHLFLALGRGACCGRGGENPTETAAVLNISARLKSCSKVAEITKWRGGRPVTDYSGHNFTHAFVTDNNICQPLLCHPNSHKLKTRPHALPTTMILP